MKNETNLWLSFHTCLSIVKKKPKNLQAPHQPQWEEQSGHRAKLLFVTTHDTDNVVSDIQLSLKGAR